MRLGEVNSVQNFKTAARIPNKFDPVHGGGEGLEHLLHGHADPVGVHQGVPEQLDVGHPGFFGAQGPADVIQTAVGP